MYEDLIGKKVGTVKKIFIEQDIRYKIKLTRPPKETAAADYDSRILRIKPVEDILEVVVCNLPEGRQQEDRGTDAAGIQKKER